MNSLTEKIRQFALRIGFDLVGFTPAEPLPQDEQALGAWLSAGNAGEMAYMARDPSRRANPKQILPEAKTIICLALNYYPGDHPPPSDHLKGRISRYAWGKDYHQVIEEKLDLLAAFLEDEADRPLKIKRYVDYGPILERAYASRAGLGFIGKNTMLITHELGSWVFLAELIIDLELEGPASGLASAGPGRGGIGGPASGGPHGSPQMKVNQKPSSNHRPFSQCGSCTLCIDACPTGAIIAPFTLDARRCISYLTIENRGEIPVPLRAQTGSWVFGCDVCQEVCPYNQQVPVTQNSSMAKGAGPWLDTNAVLSMTEETFKARFQGTPLLRPKHRGIQRNAKVVASNFVTVAAESSRTP